MKSNQQSWTVNLVESVHNSVNFLELLKRSVQKTQWFGTIPLDELVRSMNSQTKILTYKILLTLLLAHFASNITMPHKPTKHKSKSTNPESKGKTNPLSNPKRTKKRRPIRVRCTFMHCSSRKTNPEKGRPARDHRCRRRVLIRDPSQSRVGVRCRWHGGLVADKTYVSSNDADESGFDDDTQKDDDEEMNEIVLSTTSRPS